MKFRFLFLFVVVALSIMTFSVYGFSSPSASITPTSPEFSDDLVGYCSATGSEGLAYNYTWYVNGSANESGDIGLSLEDLDIYVDVGSAGVIRSVAVDSSDNIYAVGTSSNLVSGSSSTDWSINKFDSSGTEDTVNWNLSFDGSGSVDIAYGVAVDSSDNVFVVGSSYYLVNGTSAIDWWIKKFDSSGTENTTHWNLTYNSADGKSDNAYSVAVDSSDNIYVVGDSDDLISGASAYDMVIKKFFANGTEDTSWNFTFDGGYLGNDRARFVAVDSSDNVFVVGEGDDVVTGTSGTDWWIKKFSPSGIENITHWNFTFDGAGSTDVPYSIAFDSSDNVYIVGTGRNIVGATSDDLWFKKFFANGTEDTINWNLSIHATTSDASTGVAVDSSDNVYVAARSSNLIGATSTDWWLKKFNSSGFEDTTNWNLTYDSNSVADYPNAVVVDSSDKIIFAGRGYQLISGASSFDYWIKTFYADPSPSLSSGSVNVANLSNSVTTTGENWTLSCQVFNSSTTGSYVNATQVTIVDTTPPNTNASMNQTGVNDSDFDGNIELSWLADTNSDTVSYRVYRSSTNITDASSLTAIANVSGTSFEDNDTVNGSSYWYGVTSVDFYGNENKSVVSDSFSATVDDQINPVMATEVNASTASTGSVTITFTQIFEDIAGNAELNNNTYLIYRTTNASALNTSSYVDNIGNTTGSSYTDFTMTTGVNYSYIVTVIDDGGNHNYTFNSSNTVSIVPTACTTTFNYPPFSSCSSNQKSRTGTRTCYGGGATSDTQTQSCSSSSGGGSGPVVSEDSPIQAKSSSVVGIVESNKPTSLTVNKETSVTEISVKVKETKENVKITVSSLKEKPEDVKDVESTSSEESDDNSNSDNVKSSGKSSSKVVVYKYLEIEKDNFENEDLAEPAKINFVIDESWLEEQGASVDEVVLNRYFEDEWVELLTAFVSNENGELSFAAETPGFSYFAITVKQKSEEQAVVVEVVEEESGVVVEETFGKADSLNSEPVDSSDENPWSFDFSYPVVLIVIVLVVVGGLYGVHRVRDNHSPKDPPQNPPEQ